MSRKNADIDSDWSDDDEQSEIETSVLLGVPDGAIEKQDDLDDAAVSRVGGHPVRPVAYLCVYSVVLIINLVFLHLSQCDCV